MDHTLVSNIATTPDICKTLYFWWIAYLRCSSDYWWICKEEGRCEDERLHRVWKHFGNVYDHATIFHYWRERAHQLFDSPQQSLEFEHAVSAPHGLALLDPKVVSGAREDKFYISVDRALMREAAMNAFQKLWDCAILSGQRHTTDAPLQLSRIDPKSRKTIVHAYCVHVLEDLCKKSLPSDFFSHWRNYEMACFLNIFGRAKPEPSDSIRSARRTQGSVRTLFGQKKLAAQEIIANVEIGIFPSRKKVIQIPRWTICQEQRLRQAIMAREWRPRNWLLREHQFLLPHRDLSARTLDLANHPAVLIAVRDFSELDSSQLGKP
jgi:hypothetical protein